jgi:FtsH-binding integral membrane protein
MATAAAQPTRVATQLPGRRYDHIFFSASIALMLLTVIVGFGPTYYFAGVFRAPLPSPIIHVHGAIFSSWMLLLITQASLVSAHRVDIHRRLGIAGMILACLMVIVGTVAATDSMIHFPRPGRDAQWFYIIPLTDMFIFAVLIGFAYRDRRDSASHKRLILVATTALLIAAVARWPSSIVHRHVVRAGLVSDVFLVLLIAYDLWALRKVHRSTMWAGAFLLVVQNVRYAVGQTAAWHSFAGWVQATFG